LKYEVVTRVEIIHEIPVEFPAVTIMNLNDPQSNQSLKDIMPLCMFNGEPCTEDDFETIHDKYEFVYFKLKKKNNLLYRSFTGSFFADIFQWYKRIWWKWIASK
jgi:hypothetical protein